MTVENLREYSPALSRKVYGKELVYLDNAATSQRPRTVIDEWERITIQSNANIHRAVHLMAEDLDVVHVIGRVVKVYADRVGVECGGPVRLAAYLHHGHHAVEMLLVRPVRILLSPEMAAYRIARMVRIAWPYTSVCLYDIQFISV